MLIGLHDADAEHIKNKTFPNYALMIWHKSYRADPKARELADRHYNRQKIGASGFVPPGRCLVLYAENKSGKAFWVTSFPYAKYVKHEWAGAWICSAFRNEGAGIASELILQAVSATRSYFGEPPELGIITFVDEKKVKPTIVRGIKTWGRVYEKAGFKPCGRTKGGLLAFQLLPKNMPPPIEALPSIKGVQLTLYSEVT
jgi:hypothetical protein